MLTIFLFFLSCSTLPPFYFVAIKFILTINICQCRIFVSEFQWTSQDFLTSSLPSRVFLRAEISSVQFSHSVVSDSLWPHGLWHARPPCLSPTPGVYSNSCPLSQWYHPTISSSLVPFSSHLQSFPGSFPVSQFFASGGQIVLFQLQHHSFQCIFRTDLL